MTSAAADSADDAPETPSPSAAPGAATGASPSAAAPAAADLTTDVVPGPGGVMTDEVGVVTGDLTLHTEVSGDGAVVKVQYKEAEEWYTVTGGRVTLNDPADAAAVHKLAVALLNRPEG